jgi:hypothetical protein
MKNSIKNSIKNFINNKYIKFFFTSILGFIFMVLYFDAKIILRNNYEKTNNINYIILLFILIFIYIKY